MDFLEKLNYLMNKKHLNKSTLSKACDIPYTTIDGWYKKGYEGLKLTTLRKLANFFGTSLDFWANDNIEPNTNLNLQNIDGFPIASREIEHIKKYRVLDEHGKKAMDLLLEVEYERCNMPIVEEAENIVYFNIPEYLQPVSAGDGEWNDDDNVQDLLLTKAPPKGSSFVVRVHGKSMAPTYQDGDRLFVRAQDSIEEGQIGIFVIDGWMFVKELHEGYLLSHNPDYPPKPLTSSVRCQGKILGICDESYFEK